jgi:pimeloyl-ACP methyl ester carboxylesterase
MRAPLATGHDLNDVARKEPTMQRTWSNGVDIAFDDVGHGEPAIVLIHPSLGNRGHYAAMVPGLAERHRIITLDLRGHGDSGMPTDGVLLADCARDVIAVCREAGVERAVLCGHSSGGAVALMAAAAEPRLAAGVGLLDAAILLHEPVRLDGLQRFVPALEGPDRLQALRDYFGALMFGPYDPALVRTRIMDELAGGPHHVAAPLFRDIFSSDFANVVAAAPCPLIFVDAGMPADLERLRALRPDALVARVAASGHFLTLVVPDQVNAILERFLEVLPIAAPMVPATAAAR